MDAELIRIMDQLPFAALQEVPGLSYQVELPGMIGYRSDVIPNPYVNLVGLTRAAEDNVDETIDHVFRTFDGVPFGWFVGPLSSPSDLTAKLEQRGMICAEEMRGMVLDDLSISMPVNEEVSIVRVTPEEACEHAKALAAAYGMGITAEATRYIFLSVKNSDIYLVYPKDGQDPIGFSVLTHVSPDIVLLGGSAVSEAWRGKRIYKTLVQKRLSDAREAGVTKAFVQAVEETSAPICERLGFRDICRFQFYLGNITE